MIIMVTNGYKLNSLPFSSADIKEEVELTQAIASQNKFYAVFVSQIIKIPPTKPNNLDSAISCFLIPRSSLNSQIAFYIAVQEDKDMDKLPLPATIIGNSDFINDDIKHIFG